MISPRTALGRVPSNRSGWQLDRVQTTLLIEMWRSQQGKAAMAATLGWRQRGRRSSKLAATDPLTPGPAGPSAYSRGIEPGDLRGWDVVVSASACTCRPLVG